MMSITKQLCAATIFCTLASVTTNQPASAQQPESVRFQTADGLTIHGDLYRADASMDAPVILFFHQGGSAARPEYGPLVGRLLAEGYHGLAIDQRLGGSRLGGENRTVAALGAEEFGYCDAYPDLEAALSFVAERGFRGPRVLWGSSYSAALVIQLGVRSAADIAAVLAFSPASGEPMSGCEPMQFSPQINVPLLVLRPASEMELERVRSQWRTFEADGHETHVADPGVHGSSLLNAERVGASTEESWSVVLDFLRRALRSIR